MILFLALYPRARLPRAGACLHEVSCRVRPTRRRGVTLLPRRTPLFNPGLAGCRPPFLTCVGVYHEPNLGSVRQITKGGIFGEFLRKRTEQLSSAREPSARAVHALAEGSRPGGKTHPGNLEWSPANENKLSADSSGSHCVAGAHDHADRRGMRPDGGSFVQNPAPELGRGASEPGYLQRGDTSNRNDRLSTWTWWAIAQETTMLFSGLTRWTASATAR
jgi:hypothetical protein